jgi:molybdopterin-guanine dinucleotide biosynthesis protein B
LSVVGFSGSGKTTLVEGLIRELTRRGLRIGSIKHDAHRFEIDHPGKDSWRHKQAGAAVTMIASPHQIGMVRDVDRDHRLEELVPMLPEVDLVLAEGFKRGSHPKIEIHRPEANPRPACQDDPHLLAVVSDADLDWGVPRFPVNDLCALADFIERHFHLAGQRRLPCAAG